jgi:hypothetical protein
MVNTRVQLHLVPGAQADTESNVKLRGDLSVVTIFDVIQLMCTQGRAWTITLSDQEVDASVSVAGGELIDAHYAEQSGEGALVELIALRMGQFEVRPQLGDVPHTIHGPWQHNLLVAAQRLDERMSKQRTESARPSRAPAAFDMTPHQSGEFQFDEAAYLRSRVTSGQGTSTQTTNAERRHKTSAVELIDRGFAALRAGNIREARADWTLALALDPSNRALQFNLKKLEMRESESR